ncbi:DEAD/DEAH box helicase family protein [Jeotgalibaca caeni]|uniref:DEAD/DEAH box helicase family protein n=1 Tax=Jeotgalibaca caeni TaxID=3028623 RepID=UPI00237D594C|nr:DEAD/DEAH box helicase family protein [Jeotgalibaca caeni]MDE1549619.1 DEAD/DEAH box helicase family protein [Jeotgalibaca caeni]
MSLKKHPWKTSYKSFENNIIKEFYSPAIKSSISYKRIAGFFSASFLENLALEIEESIRNNNLYIQILCSPIMADKDVSAIELGYNLRNQISVMIEDTLKKISEESKALPLIADLIARNALDIKFVIPKIRSGMFHDKKGIFEDSEGNKIGFSGSSNETNRAVFDNYESIVVLNNWENRRHVYEMEEDFNEIWNEKKSDLLVLKVSRELQEKIEEKMAPYSVKETDPFSRINVFKKYPTLFDYQLEAVGKWENNEHKGLLEMATGTGKTITALACYQALSEKMEKLLSVMVVPQIELLYQWEEDVISSGASAIICSSSNPSWKRTLKNRIRRLARSDEGYLNVIVTRDTFISKVFLEIINVAEVPRLLIADEVHSFGSEGTRKKFDELNSLFPYRLGVSATPFRKNETESEQLIDFFRGIVFSYSLKEAIKNGFLNNYEYHAKVLFFDNEILEQYRKMYYENKEKIQKNDIIAIEKLTSTIANSTTSKVEELVSHFNNRSDTFQSIVYCSPGGYNDTVQRYDEKHIDFASKELSEVEGVRLRKIRSQVEPEERKEILNQFKDKELNVLMAIKCLDQGINLPEVTDAFILSSTDSPTEFIQRRGRILRRFPGKPTSYIYDFIMLPQDYRMSTFDPDEADAYLVARELRRMREYMDGSDNYFETQHKIEEIEDAYKDVLEVKEYEFSEF